MLTYSCTWWMWKKELVLSCFVTKEDLLFSLYTQTRLCKTTSSFVRGSLLQRACIYFLVSDLFLLALSGNACLWMVRRPPAGAGERNGGKRPEGFPHLQTLPDQVGSKPCMCANESSVQIKAGRGNLLKWMLKRLSSPSLPPHFGTGWSRDGSLWSGQRRGHWAQTENQLWQTRLE